MTDSAASSGALTLRAEGMIQGAVVHMANEQPFVADLFSMPTPSDLSVVCTNVRTSGGKRPVWADDQSSIFYFPLVHIRFMEIPESAMHGNGTYVRNGAAAEPADEPFEPEHESELEIDEEFLRRVRDV